METKEKKQQTESFHIAKSDAAGKTPYNESYAFEVRLCCYCMPGCILKNRELWGF